MTLHDKRYQWIYDNCERLQRAITVLDYCKENRFSGYDEKVFRKSDDEVHDLAFSFLMVAMGEHIPKTLWSVNDYSVLYGLLTDSEEIEITHGD